jgi:hypothetical protein
MIINIVKQKNLPIQFNWPSGKLVTNMWNVLPITIVSLQFMFT